jgi:hypothetical protein
MDYQNPYLAPQTTGTLNSVAVGDETLAPWDEPTRSKIINIAQQQRWVNIHFLIAIVGAIAFVFLLPNPAQRGGQGGSAIHTLTLLFLFGNGLGLMYRLYQLAKALEYRVPLLVSLCVFLGIIGLIVIVMVSNEATKYLKKFDIRVGLLGASPGSVLARLEQLQALAPRRGMPGQLGYGIPMAQDVS